MIDLAALRRSLYLAVLLPFLVACQLAPVAIDSALLADPTDPGIVSGKLNNGMRYFLRSTNGAERDNLIDVRLVVRAGSRHEKPSEAGYSHLLEHAVFRGTKHFPGKTIEQLLERYGLVWGRDVNATTHYGFTSYRFSLTEDEQELLPVIMKLYADFLSSVQLEKLSIESEKKIVKAEWMYRYGHRSFVTDPISAFVFKGTELEGIPPVGRLDIIRDATSATLREYWNRRYNPGNAALIITGSIVPWELEPTVVDHFDHLKNRIHPERAINREVSTLSRSDSGYVSYVDPETTGSEVALNFVTVSAASGVKSNTGRGFLETLLFNSIAGLMDSQLSNSRCGAVEFKSLPLDSGQTVYRIASMAGNNNYLYCMNALDGAFHKISQYKITKPEYELLQRRYRKLAIEEGGYYRAGSAGVLADRISQAFVFNMPVLPAALYETQLLRTIDQFSLSDFNQFRLSLQKNYQLIRSAVGPTEKNLPSAKVLARKPSSQSGLAKATDSGLSKAGEEKTVPAPVVRQLYEKNLLQDTEKLSEWRLENGGKVVFIPDDRYDYVAVAMVARGGLPSTNATATQLLPEAVNRGIIEFKPKNDVGNFESVESTVFVSPASYGVLAYSSAENINGLFARIGSHFREAVLSQRSINFLAIDTGFNRSGIWMSAGRRAAISEIDVNQLYQAYRSLFLSPADFTTVIIGNADKL